MVTKSSREMQKDREKIRPPFGGLKFCQGTHYLPLTLLYRNSHIPINLSHNFLPFCITKKRPLDLTLNFI